MGAELAADLAADLAAEPAPAPAHPADRWPHPARALQQAQQVFLGGNGLPARWAGQPRFVVLDTCFGLGHAFVATWAAWQRDARRCDRLVYLAMAERPPLQGDLANAHAGSPLPVLAAGLVRQWPVLTPDLHGLDFDGGRVRLLLALGSVAQVLPEWLACVDAFYLHATLPAQQPGGWDARRLRGLHRLAAPGASLAAWHASGQAGDALREGLRTAGFQPQAVAGQPTDAAWSALDIGPTAADGRAGDGLPAAGIRAAAAGLAPAGELTVARFAPRVLPAPPPGRLALAMPSGRGAQVAVVGAGLAGAAVARALAAQGVAVLVVDRQAGPAGETSGNAGGLFHGIVHGHDGPHARWLRAAALHTERLLRPLIESGQLPGAINGLLRGEQALTATQMQALLQRQGLPAAYAQARPGAGAGGQPAWFYPGGGWVSPAALCAHWLAGAGIDTRYGQAVQQLQPAGARWRLLGDGGHCLAEVDAVLLCNAADATRLAGAAGPPWPPLQSLRGQTTVLPAGHPGLPALPWPMADGGYALRLADGGLMCGGSSQADDLDPGLRAADHQRHLATLRRLTGWAGEVDLAALQGRVGWRVQADDRLPLVGAVPGAVPGAIPGALPGPASGEPAPAASRRLDQPRLVPRQPGLYVFTALGSRGITQAALGGEILASALTGAPQPVPASLLDALDPARFIARAVNRGG